MQYTCPDCSAIGAHPRTAPPPLCHKCNYKVTMQPSNNGVIIVNKRENMSEPMVISTYGDDRTLRDVPDPFNWEEGEDWLDWLKRIGCDEIEDRIGGSPSDGFEGSVEWYRRKSFDSIHPWKFVVALNTPGRMKLVLVSDEAALLDILAKLAPVAQAAMVAEAIEWFRNVAELAFQAWHGHHAGMICQRCDPAEYAVRRGNVAKKRK